MPAQAFIDDSGGKGQGKHLVLAGLIAPSERWALFSEEWAACLRQHPPIRSFKMREAAGLNGQFHRRFSEAQRDDRLRSFARIVNRYAEIAIYFASDLDALAQTWGVTSHKPFNEPYFWPFHNVIMGSCFELWDCGWRERFEIIFDEHVIFGPRAKAHYPIIREAMRLREPDAFSIMPVEPIFRSDDEFLPLQAADLFAWCFRDGSNEPPGHRFDWLLEEMRSIKQSEYCGVNDRDRILGVDKLADGLIDTSDPMLAALTEARRKHFQ